MKVHSENYKDFRISVFQMSDRFMCGVFIGAFGFHIVEYYAEEESGYPISKLFKSVEDAVTHAKAQIDTIRQ